MKEIVRISLDNEMDLILAHKRAMKLAELCGLMQSAQTRFATAVSEIARCSIANGEDSHLVLGISFLSGGKKEIAAVVFDKVDLEKCNPEAYAYASRLSRDIISKFNDSFYEIRITLAVPYSGTISEARINGFIEYFKKEAPLSAYDEIRKKNIQLIELSEKLSASESNYRKLTDTLPLIVFSINNSGIVTLANKGVLQAFGNQFTEFSSQSAAQLMYAGDCPDLLKGWENAKKKGISYSCQTRIKTKDGDVWHQVSMVPSRSDVGEVSGWTISMVDIHAQKLVEETLKDNKELRDAQESLRASNEELSRKNHELEQFAYIASHDLQEPLRKIRNFTSLAERGLSKDEKERFYFDKINHSAERMSRLIKDVLDYSRLALKTDEFSEVSLKEILEGVIDDFEFLIQEKEASVLVGDLPTIAGNPVQISQLFYNLISNSLKFSDTKPQIKVSSEITSGEEIGAGKVKFHKIQIIDNGIGIENHHASKLFTIFKRLHPQNKYEGTGIGLALCKKIVDNHGGAIKIAGAPDGGTVVDVYLPV